MKIKYALVGFVTGALGGASYTTPRPAETLMCLVVGGLIGLGLGYALDNIRAMLPRPRPNSTFSRGRPDAGADTDGHDEPGNGVLPQKEPELVKDFRLHFGHLDPYIHD